MKQGYTDKLTLAMADVLETAEGRLVLARVILQGKPTVCFSKDPLEMARQCGILDWAEEMSRTLRRANPEKFDLMVTENKKNIEGV